MDHDATFSSMHEQEARFERTLATLSTHAQQMVRRALAFAMTAHEGQVRKGDVGTPYIIHPLRVATALMEEFAVHDANAVCAALFHDVVEDCDVSLDAIAAEFGDTVAGYVRWLTWVPGRDAKWRQMEEMRKAPAVVRMVKAADILDNARDIAVTPSLPRRITLRLLYGYDHWGRTLLATLGSDAVAALDRAIARAYQTHFGDDPEPPFPPNAGKVLVRSCKPTATSDKQEAIVARYPVRTSVVREGDDLVALIAKHAVEYVRSTDTLVISERVVAITQGRAYRIDEIRPRPLAKMLVRFVSKNPAGIGLAIPETMELALREAGVVRILFAAFVAAVTKPFGMRGLFYRVAGHGVNAIDGPCDYTLPPYNAYAVLGPSDPNGVAERLARRIGVRIAIIDANDLGVEVLGASEGVHRTLIREAFRDNPLGQSSEQTPMAIVRAVQGKPTPDAGSV